MEASRFCRSTPCGCRLWYPFSVRPNWYLRRFGRDKSVSWSPGLQGLSLVAVLTEPPHPFVSCQSIVPPTLSEMKPAYTVKCIRRDGVLVA